MKTYRTNAVAVGVLYIVGTVAGIRSLALLQPVRDAGDLLAGAAANADQVLVGALFVMLMGLSLAMVPVFMYPVLSKQSEVLALGYLVLRGALETVTYFVTVFSWLLLRALGQAYVGASASAASAFQPAGALLLKAAEVTLLTGTVFCLGALLFYTALYRSRLMPRWISAWGLVALIPYLAAEFLTIFAVIMPNSTVQTLMYLPLAIQETVLAAWLIVRGFNQSALAATPALPKSADVALDLLAKS